MVGVPTACGTVLKGRSVRKAENHCLRRQEESCLFVPLTAFELLETAMELNKLNQQNVLKK